MSRTIRPLGDNVVVRVIERAEQIRGGLYIPDVAKNNPTEAEVVAVGPGSKSRYGSSTTVPLVPGERVLFAEYSGAGRKVVLGDDELMVLRQADILAVLEDSDV